MTRTLLIDGDVFAYQAAASSERIIHWSEAISTLESSLSEARVRFESHLDSTMTALKADEFVIALSDLEISDDAQTSFSVYWRRDILPTYKAHRKGVRKPIVLRELREYILATYDCKIKPRLEGDDVLGILSTHPTLIKGEKVIVSIDKDMKTIPGLFCRNLVGAELEIVEISDGDADYWHMYQTLTGDATDGYKGCPGMGPKGAEKILDPIWKSGTVLDCWPAVVAAYKKAGLNEAIALTQARVARILRHTDYDFKGKKPILWNPPTTATSKT